MLFLKPTEEVLEEGICALIEAVAAPFTSFGPSYSKCSCQLVAIGTNISISKNYFQNKGKLTLCKQEPEMMGN